MSNEIITDLAGLQLGFPFNTATNVPVTIARSFAGSQVAMEQVHHDFKRYGVMMPVRTRTNETTFMDFYNSHGGQLDTFLFLDPKRNFIERVQIGTGDGVEDTFQLKNKDGYFRTEIQEAPTDALIWAGGVPQVKGVDYDITYYSSGKCVFKPGKIPGAVAIENEFYFWRRGRFASAPMRTNEVGNNNIMLAFDIEEVLP